jgi:acyl-CoA reductase-like NAD-dependent aldehyde dehydrogenase
VAGSETVADTPEVHHETGMLVDGALVDAATHETFDSVNPATEEVRDAIEAQQDAWETDLTDIAPAALASTAP